MAELDLEIVGVNRSAQLDFLDAAGVLVFARFLFLLGLFVPVPAVVDYTADRWGGIWSHLDKVHVVCAGHFDCLMQGQDAHLGTLWPDNSDFASANLAVDPDSRSSRRRMGTIWATQGALLQ